MLAGVVKVTDYLLSLEVRRIAVSGSLQHIEASDIESRLAEEVGAGFLFADLERIRHRLESMPWVYVAEVRRHWPDTLAIRVTEQQPIARWGSDSYLNHEGDIFAGVRSGEYAELPRLEGPEGSSQLLMRRYLRLESVLSPLGIEIIHLAQDSLRQIEVTFADGTELQLGDQQFALRLQRFARLWQHELQGRHVARIDMRYEHGAAVTPAPEQLAMSDTNTEESD
jgi:cell division protein FtsQ